MKTNTKATDYRFDEENLAGGMGLNAAKQSPEQRLRRVVLTNLLWEDQAYCSGKEVVNQIQTLIPQVSPERVAAIAEEAKIQQKLRHVPLLIAREMARLEGYRDCVGDVLPTLIQRPDDLSEFLALYWQDGKCPIAKQVKKGLAKAFIKFDAYQLAKWNRDDKIKLRDVMFMVHPKPNDDAQAAVWKQLVDGTLHTPDTWEVSLSAGKDKKETFERLIQDRKLGALAFLRNLRNMIEAKVDDEIILQGFKTINPQWLLPTHGLVAARHAPQFTSEIEDLLMRCLANKPKLSGKTIMVVDVSGSMGQSISSKSELNRLDVATAIAFLVRECCERVLIYATAGSDGASKHATKLIPNQRGFALVDKIRRSQYDVGLGGIFTRQCLAYIKQDTKTADRIIVFSDSQDCDRVKKVPQPFGTYNYIIDVSAHERGVNYEGIWTAEISGWSERVIDFIYASEGLTVD